MDGALSWSPRIGQSHSEIAWQFPQGSWRDGCANVSNKTTEGMEVAVAKVKNNAEIARLKS